MNIFAYFIFGLVRYNWGERIGFVYLSLLFCRYFYILLRRRNESCRAQYRVRLLYFFHWAKVLRRFCFPDRSRGLPLRKSMLVYKGCVVCLFLRIFLFFRLMARPVPPTVAPPKLPDTIPVVAFCRIDSRVGYCPGSFVNRFSHIVSDRIESFGGPSCYCIVKGSCYKSRFIGL